MEDIDDDSDHKEGCETEGWALLPGQRVRARIVGQQPWGVFAKIIGYTRVRLSIRPQDLESLTGWCDFCRQPVTLSPGGGGLVLEVRSNDGPGSHQVISHRGCLADRLHPLQSGERARTLGLQG